MYSPGEFHRIEVKKANRWIKDVLKPVGGRMILGSADLGWETRRGEGYIQIHLASGHVDWQPRQFKTKAEAEVPQDQEVRTAC
jgi:hypothetical protein